MEAVSSHNPDVQTFPSDWEFSCDLEVDYKSQEIASIVYSTLDVDEELQPDRVKRQMAF